MKRILLAFALIMLMAVQSWATWTLTPSSASKSGHYYLWKVVCTSDGSSLAATDIVPLLPASVKNIVQGSSMMVMKVSPGVGTVAPDATINVTLSDAQGTAVFSGTGYSYTADTTGISLADSFKQYPTIFDVFYLTINDIGAAGDQVTLYFFCWLEDK